MRHLLTRLAFVFPAGLIIVSFGAAAQPPTSAGSWTQKTPMPTVRGEVAAAAIDNKLFALGGGAGGKAVPRSEEYDPASNRWRERAPLPQARDHLGVATYGGKIYTFGGSRPPCTKAPAMWCSHMILQPISGRRSRG